MERHRQGADRLPHSARRAESRDHEFLLAVTLDLDEIVRTAGPVGRVAQLGDDALEIELLGLIENDAAVAIKVFDRADRAVISCRQQTLQFGLALDQRQPSEIAAIKIQKIKHVIDEAIAAAGFQIGLQQRKARQAFLILDDKLAVEERSVGLELGDRRGDRLETVRPDRKSTRLNSS